MAVIPRRWGWRSFGKEGRGGPCYSAICRSLTTGTRSMTERPSANLEMALVLPLGVIANQLMRIEADLRLLNMKAVDLARERESGRHTGLIEARLERINEALDAIRSLVGGDPELNRQPQRAAGDTRAGERAVLAFGGAAFGAFES